MSKVSARKLKGFRDYLPRAATARNAVVAEITRQAKAAGFLAIDTPALEYAEVLLGTGGDTEKELYRFQDHGERDVGLRFDLTVPFARFVTEHYNELVLPFKKLQIGDVWRGEKPQKGRYRQFMQADLDIVGVDSLAADVETISCLMRSIAGIVSRPITLSLNSRLILSSIIKHELGELSTEQSSKVFIAIDKLAKIGQDKVASLIEDACGKSAQSLIELIANGELNDSYGGFSDIRPDVERFNETATLLAQSIDSELVTIKIDHSIARGLGYYTGIVFETTIDDLPGFGSISSGGRYDQLVSRFGKYELSGVGGSIGVDRLLAAMEELNCLPSMDGVDVYLLVTDSFSQSVGLSLAAEWRHAGCSVDVAVRETKIANHFKYADKRRASLVAILGQDEIKNNTISLKNLSTGEQVSVPTTDAVSRIKQLLP